MTFSQRFLIFSSESIWFFLIIFFLLALLHPTSVLIYCLSFIMHAAQSTIHFRPNYYKNNLRIIIINNPFGLTINSFYNMNFATNLRINASRMLKNCNLVQHNSRRKVYCCFTVRFISVKELQGLLEAIHTLPIEKLYFTGLELTLYLDMMQLNCIWISCVYVCWIYDVVKCMLKQ